MRISVVGFEKDLEKLKKVAGFLGGEIVIYEKNVWERLADHDAIVAIMPTGIVVRGLCGIVKSKWVDPAVVVIDKGMNYAVPLLGGHHGANEIALRLEKLGMRAVITTAMEFEDGLSVGIGFRKNVGAEEIICAIEKALKEIGAGRSDIRVISTWEGKKGSEELRKVSDYFKRPLMFLSDQEINSMDVSSESKAERIGLKSVSEACALYFSRERKILLPKKIYGGVTVAIAR
ncbi:cobalamin biosynthesis protein [Geoglobus acetivorans]|nr:cobalamin biosynthesis protein [Geoglobus acetivorans]